MRGDVVVYRSGTTHYLACFADGVWFRWPACEHGWLARRPAKEDDSDPNAELEVRLARLALLLSGVDEDGG